MSHPGFLFNTSTQASSLAGSTTDGVVIQTLPTIAAVRLVTATSPFEHIANLRTAAQHEVLNERPSSFNDLAA